MTEERKDEILRKVVYRNINRFNINDANTFNFGRIIGFIQKDLEIELSKEVENTKNN